MMKYTFAATKLIGVCIVTTCVLSGAANAQLNKAKKFAIDAVAKQIAIAFRSDGSDAICALTLSASCASGRCANISRRYRELVTATQRGVDTAEILRLSIRYRRTERGISRNYRRCFRAMNRRDGTMNKLLDEAKKIIALSQ